MARHFDEAAQIAGIGCVDLVDDDPGATAGQPRIAGDISGQSGLAGAAGIVKDHAPRIDVEAAIAVHRQTAGIGLLDVDHRHAIATAEDASLLRRRGVAVDQDLRMDHAVPGQCEGNTQPQCRTSPRT
ncbi:hypothetical protein J2S30_003598 [Herbaspirillum rubrisubalbicans]|nr:hypothetical protein [Herbaspirillum rubrisubalbicans]MCP1575219.1 hypothetical protein [Herbaspirillum rubrisubalbicans]